MGELYARSCVFIGKNLLRFHLKRRRTKVFLLSKFCNNALWTGIGGPEKGRDYGSEPEPNVELLPKSVRSYLIVLGLDPHLDRHLPEEMRLGRGPQSLSQSSRQPWHKSNGPIPSFRPPQLIIEFAI